MKPFAVYSILKYLQRTVKNFCEKCPIYVFSTWGAYYQIFSQFLEITLNNVVKKFAKFFNFLKICEKNSQSFLRKCMREKLLIKVSAIQILIDERSEYSTGEKKQFLYCLLVSTAVT